MERHFTASVFVLKGEEVLLIFHPKFQKWLTPGGHVEPNESPPEAARREVREETGLEITWIKEEQVWVKRPNAYSIERPFACFVEEVPAFGSEKAHQHIDFLYLATPIGDRDSSFCPDHPMRWWKKEEIDQLNTPEEIFPETKEIIEVIFTKHRLPITE